MDLNSKMFDVALQYVNVVMERITKNKAKGVYPPS